jgi:hypothetical protein
MPEEEEEEVYSFTPIMTFLDDNNLDTILLGL